jgi:hypothetical protein
VVCRLERGGTGFFDPKDGPLPEVDARAYRAAWHAAARAAGGRVSNWTEQKYPRTYHTASLTARRTLNCALCHACLPLVAFVSEPSYCHQWEFRDPPPWSPAPLRRRGSPC